MHLDLLVPVKGLAHGKSRLRPVSCDDAAHAELVLALALDTVTAAMQVHSVRRLLAITADEDLRHTLRAHRIDVLPEHEPGGLNAALRQGFEALWEPGGHAMTGALQSDLPALRPADLAAALAEADGRRTFCPDRHGSGTTLLLSAAGERLRPAFGPGSAEAHLASGALQLRSALPTLRCDVDTVQDLAAAATLGLGPRTAALLPGTVVRDNMEL